MRVIWIFIFLSIHGINAQIKSGIVEYKVKFVNEIVVDDSKPQSVKRKFDEVKEETKLLTYILTFNKNTSMFKLQNYIEENKTLAKILFGFEEYYCNLKQSSIVKRIEDIYIGIDNNKFQWELTSETKMIDTYLCYKATKDVKYKSRKGVSTKKIIAWYCPKINFQFGPKEYNSLPGLILELQDNNSIYTVNRIELKNEYINIDFPNKKLITQDEYNEKIKQNFN